jgi:hypothetical protein
MIINLLFASLALASASMAQDAKVTKILKDYEAARPAVQDLGWWQLDWAPNLKEARAKASKESRPICLLVCVNVFGDMKTGHC